MTRKEIKELGHHIVQKVFHGKHYTEVHEGKVLSVIRDIVHFKINGCTQTLRLDRPEMFKTGDEVEIKITKK